MMLCQLHLELLSFSVELFLVFSVRQVTPDSQNDFGSYNCTATNEMGTESKEFLLIQAGLCALQAASGGGGQQPLVPARLRLRSGTRWLLPAAFPSPRPRLVSHICFSLNKLKL